MIDKSYVAVVEDIKEQKNKLIKIYDGLHTYKYTEEPEKVTPRASKQQKEETRKISLSEKQKENATKKIVVVRKKKSASIGQAQSKR